MKSQIPGIVKVEGFYSCCGITYSQTSVFGAGLLLNRIHQSTSSKKTTAWQRYENSQPLVELDHKRTEHALGGCLLSDKFDISVRNVSKYI